MEILCRLRRCLYENGVDCPFILMLLGLPDGVWPTLFDPSSPCFMPPDGTYVRLSPASFLLFSNECRPSYPSPPRRYPLPLRVSPLLMDEQGNTTPLPSDEADRIMRQAYQQTCVDMENLDRPLLPAVAIHAARIVRRCHNDEAVRRQSWQYLSQNIGGMADWRNGGNSPVEQQQPSDDEPTPPTAS